MPPDTPNPVKFELNLGLTLTNLSGVPESTQQLQEWIAQCLNCNTNRVQVEVHTLVVSAGPGSP